MFSLSQEPGYSLQGSSMQRAQHIVCMTYKAVFPTPHKWWEVNQASSLAVALSSDTWWT